MFRILMPNMWLQIYDRLSLGPNDITIPSFDFYPTANTPSVCL